MHLFSRNLLPRKSFGLLVLGFIVLSVVIAQPAFAYKSKIQELFDKEMPEFEKIPEDRFNAITYEQTDVPFGDNALAYSIRLPEGWKESDSGAISNYNLSTHLLGSIVEYYSPPRLESVRSRFEIKALRLEFELTAEQWLLQHVLGNGYTLEGLEYYDKNKVGALYVNLKDGETFVTRLIAQINGKRMISAQYVIPAAQWEKEAALIAQSLDTFELLNPDDSAIEPMYEHMILDIAKFSYPASWKLDTQPVRTVDRISATVSNYNKNHTTLLDGLVEVNLISAYIASDLKEELSNIKLDYRNKGLVIDELIHTIEDFEFHDDVEFGFIDVYKATDTQNKSMDYEVWLGVLAMDSYYGFVTLMTPSSDSEFFIWSRNTSAFETMIRSLSLQDNNITIMDDSNSNDEP